MNKWNKRAEIFLKFHRSDTWSIESAMIEYGLWIQQRTIIFVSLGYLTISLITYLLWRYL